TSLKRSSRKCGRSCSCLAGPEHGGRNPLDRRERGDILSMAPGGRWAEDRAGEAPEGVTLHRGAFFMTNQIVNSRTPNTKGSVKRRYLTEREVEQLMDAAVALWMIWPVS